jgi:hypothetical protein
MKSGMWVGFPSNPVVRAALLSIPEFLDNRSPRSHFYLALAGSSQWPTTEAHGLSPLVGH